MPLKVLTIFDARLSNIFTLLPIPAEASRFPLFGQTSIQKVQTKKTEIKLKKK